MVGRDTCRGRLGGPSTPSLTLLGVTCQNRRFPPGNCQAAFGNARANRSILSYSRAPSLVPRAGRPYRSRCSPFRPFNYTNRISCQEGFSTGGAAAPASESSIEDLNRGLQVEGLGGGG